jgi:hypothetical protein
MNVRLRRLEAAGGLYYVHGSTSRPLSKLAAKTLTLNEAGGLAWQWIGYACAGFEVVHIGAPGRSISRCDLVGKTGRVNLMHHRPAVLWLTGLPGSGK